MRILHIANSYGGTSVYTNLYTALDKQADIEQFVYVPLNSRNHERVGKKMIDFKNNVSQIHYSTVLKSYHKFLYTLKIRCIVKDIEKTFDISKIDVIHAGTAFLDGAAAYELSKKYHIPYIVTVRDTDVHTYYSKLVHKRGYFHNILINSEEVVFISPRYKVNFLGKIIPQVVSKSISDKCVVRTNGVDQIFLDNLKKGTKQLNEEIRLLYTGAFISRKALLETINAVALLREKGLKVRLNAVGKGLPFRGNEADYISKVEECGSKYDWLQLKDFKPLSELIEEMKDADIFIMNSHTETFGLCYVEALTQSLPVIYTKGQGFDGQFEEGYVGASVDSRDIDNIAQGIEYVISHYTELSNNIRNTDLYSMFCWDKIADGYINLYKRFLSK